LLESRYDKQYIGYTACTNFKEKYDTVYKCFVRIYSGEQSF